MNFLNWISSGEWSYKKYKRDYRDKFNRPIDISIEYIAQLPYLKIVGYPVASVMTVILFSPYIAMFVWYSIQNKFVSLFKKDRENV